MYQCIQSRLGDFQLFRNGYCPVKCYLSTMLPFAELTSSNPVEALIFFRLLYSNCLNWKFTAMIVYHFYIHPQFIYESFHMHYIFPQIELFVGCAPATGKKSSLAETVSKQF